MRPASEAEKARLAVTFADLCRIKSPSWEESACAARGAPAGGCGPAPPTLCRIEAEFHGKAAHAGLRPQDGHSAILAAAYAATRMPHGRIDAQTTANLGYFHGGVESTNVVAERARLLAEVRSVDADRADEVLARVIDALHDGASHGECDVDVITEKQVVGYRQKPSSPAVAAAQAALRAVGH